MGGAGFWLNSSKSKRGRPRRISGRRVRPRAPRAPRALRAPRTCGGRLRPRGRALGKPRAAGLGPGAAAAAAAAAALAAPRPRWGLG